MTNDRRLGLTDTKPTLAALKACREAMVTICRLYPPRHPLAREAHWLMTDIDNMAGILTGDHQLFHGGYGHGVKAGR